MTKWTKVLLGIALSVVAILGFVSWYKIHYSMAPARAFEVNTREAEPKVLIATQGSAFKDSVVTGIGIIAHLKRQSTYVKVVDVTALPNVDEAEWNAIVVIHTWEMHKPQADAKKFIERAGDLHKVIVMSTSGAGTFRMDGIDAISTASVMTDVPARIDKIDRRLDAILNARDVH